MEIVSFVGLTDKDRAEDARARAPVLRGLNASSDPCNAVHKVAW
jgi:hypothetical protein